MSDKIRMGFWCRIGFHRWRLVRWSPWGNLNWHQYEADSRCGACGAIENEFGLTHADMLRRGIDPERRSQSEDDLEV